MNELQINLSNNEGEWLIDSLQIAKGFEIEHKNLCESLSRHFSGLKRVNITDSGTAGRRQTAYLLNKTQIMMLPAICRPTERTIKFQELLVTKFLEMERELVSPKLPQNYLDALEALVIAERSRQALELSLDEAKPHVEWSEKQIEARGCMSFKTLATEIGDGCGQNKLTAFLREQRIIYYKDYYPMDGVVLQSFVPYAGFESWFRIVETRGHYRGSICIYLSLAVTAKGQVLIGRRWRELYTDPTRAIQQYKREWE